MPTDWRRSLHVILQRGQKLIAQWHSDYSLTSKQAENPEVESNESSPWSAGRALYFVKRMMQHRIWNVESRANREGMLAARILMVLSASIIFTLGLVHLVYTFGGPQLTPRDPALQLSMSQISPVITKETTMWRAWMGFNASHSMGLIFFGLVFGFLALAHDQLLFRSPFLIVVGLAMLGGFVVLCKAYFFSAPLTGVCISLACYIASIALSRASIMRT